MVSLKTQFLQIMTSVEKNTTVELSGNIKYGTNSIELGLAVDDKNIPFIMDVRPSSNKIVFKTKQNDKDSPEQIVELRMPNDGPLKIAVTFRERPLSYTAQVNGTDVAVPSVIKPFNTKKIVGSGGLDITSFTLKHST